MKESNNNIKVLTQLFNSLSDKEKQDFLSSLSSHNTEQSISSILPKEITCCPHCQSDKFVKNGKRNSNQRYRCSTCGKSFVEQTNTILSHSKKDIEVWNLYIHCMIEQYPLRKCAKICNIDLHTAFNWRHKILDSLQDMMNGVELDGIVEADETFTTISYKGHHKNFKLPRPAHKRGTKASKRGLSKEQVCIPCGINLNGLSIAKISNLGKPSLKSLEKVLSGNIVSGSVLVTDMLRPYQKLSNDMELNHIRIPRNKRSNGAFNIQMINNYHKRLKDMIIGNFKGVSTKYLNNYLVYHNFVNFAKGSIEKKKAKLLDYVRNTMCIIKTTSIADRPAVPIL